MAFTDLLNNILSAVYGKDVRQSIHDALKECHSIAEDANTEAKTTAESTYNAINNLATNVIPYIAGNAAEAKMTAEEAKEVAEAAEDKVVENKSDIDNLRTIIYLLLEPVNVQLHQNIGWRRSGPSRFVQETFSDGLHQGAKMLVEPEEAYIVVTYMNSGDSSEISPIILSQTGDSEESGIVKAFDSIQGKGEYIVVIPDDCYYMFISSERSDLGNIEVKKLRGRGAS